MNEASTAPLPRDQLVSDTHDMVVIHRVFRREFGRLPRLVASVTTGDTDRARRIEKFARELLTALHHHHTTEDELLWPRLLDRAGLDTALIERMERQHEELATLLDRAEELLTTFATIAAADTGDQLAHVLTEVSALLDQHLAEEELEVLPVVRRHITVGEWGELHERGMASIPPERRLVFLGHLLADTSAEERRTFLAALPAPARLLYRLIGERRYQREMTALTHGLPVSVG